MNADSRAAFQDELLASYDTEQVAAVEPLLPTLTINDVSVVEGDKAVFTVELSAASERPVSVRYLIADGTEQLDEDYLPNGSRRGTLTFEPGETLKTITVDTMHDVIEEGARHFWVFLSKPEGAEIADSMGVGAVLDNDTTPVLRINDVSVTAGNDAVFIVSLSNPSDKEITFEVSTSLDPSVLGMGVLGTASQPIRVRADFFPGETIRKLTFPTFDVSPGNSSDEFTLSLDNLWGATSDKPVGTATVASPEKVKKPKKDEDPEPDPTSPLDEVVQMSHSNSYTFTVTMDDGSGGSVDEGDSDHSITFTVEANDLADGESATFSWWTSPGTATADGTQFNDYYTANSSIEFVGSADTTPSDSFSVGIQGDEYFEDDEYFYIGHDAGSTQVTLVNDDTKPVVSINDVSETEGTDSDSSATTSMTFAVSLSAASNEDVVVGWYVYGGTASEGDDYSIPSFESLTFSAGDTNDQTIMLNLVPDNIHEGDETFQISIYLDTPNIATINDYDAIGTIIDDDSEPTVSIYGEYGDEEYDEGHAYEYNSSIGFAVVLSNPSSSDVNINFNTADDPNPAEAAATPDTDYDAVPTSENSVIYFAGSSSSPGNVSAAASVSLNDDDVDEYDESFMVEVTNPSNGSTDNAIGVIWDDDSEPLVSIDPTEASVLEGTDGEVSFTLKVTGETERDVTVYYTTEQKKDPLVPAHSSADVQNPETSVDPYDFEGITNDSWTFSPSAGVTEQSHTFTVAIYDDNVDEHDEKFFLTLTSADNGEVDTSAGKDEAEVTIQDFWVDVDVDSDNDGTIEADDDDIELDMPGKILAVGIDQLKDVQLKAKLGDSLDLADFTFAIFFDDSVISMYDTAGNEISNATLFTDTSVITTAQLLAGVTVHVDGIQLGTSVIALAATENSGTGATRSDGAKVTVALDLDTDSNNDGTVQDTDNYNPAGTAEDMIEHDASAIGKIVLKNGVPAQVTLDFDALGSNFSSHSVKLIAAAGLNVWTDAAKTTRPSTHTSTSFLTDDTLGETYVWAANTSPPSILYIEGSSTVGGRNVQWQFIAPDSSTILARDTVNFTVLALQDVTFSGAGFHAVSPDVGGSAYTAKQWRIENGQEIAEPISFTRNTTMTVSTTLSSSFTPANAQIMIRGDGPDGMDFPATAVDDPADVKIDNVPADQAFANEVDVFDPSVGSGSELLEIDWQISFDNGITWHDAGTSANPAYITLKNPLTSDLYHTVVALSSKNADGEKEEDAQESEEDLFQRVVDKIWAEFSDRDVHRLPRNQQEEQDPSLTQLTYYKDYLTPNYNTKMLLEDGDGRCTAWVDLFASMYKAQGISYTDDGVRVGWQFQDPQDLDAVATGFLLKEWSFTEPGVDPDPDGVMPYVNLSSTNPVQSGGYSWDYADVQDVGTGSLPGQGNNNPASLFENHVVVHAGSKYYDPSYGLAYDSEQDLLDALDSNTVAFYLRYPVGVVREADYGVDLNNNGTTNDVLNGWYRTTFAKNTDSSAYVFTVLEEGDL